MQFILENANVFVTGLLLGAAAMNAGMAAKSWQVGSATLFGLAAIISAIIFN